MIRITEGERKEVAAMLRGLPTDAHKVMEQMKGEGLYMHCCDQADYYLIHHAVSGCLPAEHMHPCDYEELHDRLADLIEPEELTCHIVMIATGFWECDACSGGIDWDSYDAGDPPACNYCPNCGRRVIHDAR